MDKKSAINLIQENIENFLKIPKPLQADIDILLTTLKQDIRYIIFVSDTLKAKPEFFCQVLDLNQSYIKFFENPERVLRLYNEWKYQQQAEDTTGGGSPEDEVIW